MAQWPRRPQYPQQRQQYPQPQTQGETDWQLTGVQWASPGQNLRPGFVKQRPNYNYPNNYQKPNYNRPNYNGRPNYNQPNYNSRPNYGNYYGKKVDTSYLAPVSRPLISV